MPAVTEPPGLLMYSQMSFSLSSPSRYSSWAHSWLAMSSSTAAPSSTTRSLRRRLKTSERGSKGVSSMLGVDAAMTPRLPERSRPDPDADLVNDVLDIEKKSDQIRL